MAEGLSEISSSHKKDRDSNPRQKKLRPFIVNSVKEDPASNRNIVKDMIQTDPVHFVNCDFLKLLNQQLNKSLKI